MASFMPAVAVSIMEVLGLYFVLELTAPEPVFSQSLLNTPADELISIAQDHESGGQIKAIHQLANRPKSLDSSVPVLARLTMSSTNSNPRVMAAAETSLKNIGEPAAEILKPFFDEKTKRGTLLGCSAAQAIGDPCKVYLPQLKELLNNGDQVDRHSALYALKGIGVSGAELLDDVIACLSDKDFNVRLMACRVLETYGAKAAKSEPELLRLLEKGTPSVRGRAAICLASIGPKLQTANVEDLIAERLAGKGNRPVIPVEHERHLMALAMLGDKSKKHLEKIKTGLTHRSPLIQVCSAFTIYQITGETDETTKVLESLDKNDIQAAQALDTLGRFGGEASPFVPAVKKFLDSGDPVNRENAIVTLMRIGTDDPDIIKRIRRMVNDADPEVKLAAKEAMESLKLDNK